MGTEISKSKYISKRYVKFSKKDGNRSRWILFKIFGYRRSNSNKKGFNGADDIADWFKNDRSDDWRQRD